MFKFILKKTIFLVPPFLLFESFISSWFEYSPELHFIIGNIAGFSLVTNLVFVYIFFFTRRYCFFTKACVIGLILLNVLCLFGGLIDYYAYSKYYTAFTTAIVVLMWLIYTVRK